MPSKNKDYTSGISATGLKPLAAVIYAAAAGEDEDMMKQVGSVVLNRLESGRADFGAQNGSIIEVINHKNGFYETYSDLYDAFMNGKFTNELEKKKALMASSVASALTRGTINRLPGQFWQNDKEIANLKRTDGMDYTQLQEVGRTGKKKQFRVFSYKDEYKSPNEMMNDFGFQDPKQFQQFLVDNGQDIGVIDGMFGKKTKTGYLNLRKNKA